MMTGATMTFALLGFLSPANRYHVEQRQAVVDFEMCRGGLMTAFLLLFVFMGSFAGYHAARLYVGLLMFRSDSVATGIRLSKARIGKRMRYSLH